jgi:hypothetical protein
MRWVLIWVMLVGVAFAQAAGAEPIKLPSGQQVTLLEALGNSPGSNGVALRYRFLAPAVARDGGSIDADTAGADMDWLCQTYALPRLPVTGPMPAEIIISMADRDVPFGESDPEATQFFNAYSIETSIDGANCLWEPF